MDVQTRKGGFLRPIVFSPSVVPKMLPTIVVSPFVNLVLGIQFTGDFLTGQTRRFLTMRFEIPDISEPASSPLLDRCPLLTDPRVIKAVLAALAARK